jgi:FkbM family methyltransferase
MIRLLDAAIRVKSGLKEFTPPVLWHILRITWAKFRGSYSESGIDKELITLLPYKHGFYVEVGANDGLSSSNTALLEKQQGWTGILIEPIPHKFLKCLQNRSQRNFVSCSACVSFTYSKEFVELMYSDKMTIGINLESDIDEPLKHAHAGLRFIPKQNTFLFLARARTLTSILIEAHAPKEIDFLSVDVEGAELEVLRGIDFNQFTFKYILVECRDFKVMIEFMNANGFKLCKEISQKDLLFSKEAFLI